MKRTTFVSGLISSKLLIGIGWAVISVAPMFSSAECGSNAGSGPSRSLHLKSFLDSVKGCPETHSNDGASGCCKVEKTYSALMVLASGISGFR